MCTVHQVVANWKSVCTRAFSQCIEIRECIRYFAKRFHPLPLSWRSARSGESNCSTTHKHTHTCDVRRCWASEHIAALATYGHHLLSLSACVKDLWAAICVQMKSGPGWWGSASAYQISDPYAISGSGALAAWSFWMVWLFFSSAGLTMPWQRIFFSQFSASYRNDYDHFSLFFNFFFAVATHVDCGWENWRAEKNIHCHKTTPNEMNEQCSVSYEYEHFPLAKKKKTNERLVIGPGNSFVVNHTHTQTPMLSGPSIVC